MKVFGFEFGSRQPVSSTARVKDRSVRRGAGRFAAGKSDNLVASFSGSHLSINEECHRYLARMQYRARDLAMNNDYARKFLNVVNSNIVGPGGIKLKCQFIDREGNPDLGDQARVEKQWQLWSKRKYCSVDGKLSWHDIQSLAIKTIARDGEVLIQKVRTKESKYFLKLRVLECDHLDTNHNQQLPDGRRIVMGVELDRNDRPRAYWLTSRHPGEYGSYEHINRRRVPAEEILHLFITERPGQVRGVPWMHSAIRRLNMLGGYEEAELVAARIGASKMGFYTSTEATEMIPDGVADDSQEYDDYDLVAEVEPGEFHRLPPGVDLTSFDPQHPTAAFPDFARAMLRGVTAGLNISYASGSNDLTDVNFSSIRAGVLDERDQWRMLQNWFSDVLHNEIYDEWIGYQVEHKGAPLTMLPADKIETKYSDVAWQARGWDWVDPAKDIKAKIDEYFLGTTTLTEIAAAKGKDLNDIFKQRQSEIDLANSYGLSVGQVVKKITNEEADQDGRT